MRELVLSDWRTSSFSWMTAPFAPVPSIRNMYVSMFELRSMVMSAASLSVNV